MITLTVNGKTHHLQADPDKPLLWVLRDELGLKGTKYGCGVGVCGACLVLLDGEPNHACMVPLGKVAARQVTTIEGMGEDHPLIQAWIAEQTPQCGYCQPAQIIAATALLRQNPNPDDAAIDAALSGVLCRCGTYQRIRRAIHAAAQSRATAATPLRVPGLLDALPEDAGVALNEWIWINRDNAVTLMINHSEMGQGALTGLAVLFAEELDVELAQLRPVFAPVDACYENGLWGGQFTGGSSSIRREWTRLRTVAAKTRARLVAAAAQRWGIEPEQCRTESARVMHPQTGRRLAYAELAEDAAQLQPPRQAALDKGGLPSAWFARVAGPGLALDGVDLPYAIPHLREEHFETDSAVPVGAWRSVGASNNAFPVECFIDELAHRAGRDPLEYRIALLDDAPRHRAALELAASKAGWGAPIGAGRGRGVAVYHSFDAVVAQVAEVSVTAGVIRVERVGCAIDCGIVVTPDAVRAQLEGGIAFGLSAALHEEIRIADGRVQQASLQDYPILTLPEMPEVEVHIVPSKAPPGGVGEPGVPVIAPAVANAVFAATGQRLRLLPLRPR